MKTETENRELEQFAARLNEVCDDMDIPPKGRARQTSLGALFDVSQKGARKWLEAEGYPALSMSIRIAEWASVNVEWLLTGKGPKRVGEIHGSSTTVSSWPFGNVSEKDYKALSEDARNWVQSRINGLILEAKHIFKAR